MKRESDYGVPIPGRILPPEQWAKTAVKRLPAGPLDLTALFGREAPLVLDLGCGNGRFLLASAVARPQFNHLGIDILPLVIRYATKRANQRGLNNARLAVCGAHEFLEQYIPQASAAEIHLYHPQPYRDESEGHRRLITPEFLALVHAALTAEGLFVVQTDNARYWGYLERVLPALFSVTPLTGPWPDAPQGRTRREIYARQHRMRIFKAQCRPRALSPEMVHAKVEIMPRPRFEE